MDAISTGVAITALMVAVTVPTALFIAASEALRQRKSEVERLKNEIALYKLALGEDLSNVAEAEDPRFTAFPAQYIHNHGNMALPRGQKRVQKSNYSGWMGP